MSFRQFIAFFMIFVSFSAQAREEFACGMSPVVVAAHDCCPHGKKSPCAGVIGVGDCCDRLVSGDAPLGQALISAFAAQQADLEIGGVGPAFLPVATALYAAMVVNEEGLQNRREPAVGWYRVEPVYLRTARLRL